MGFSKLGDLFKHALRAASKRSQLTFISGSLHKTHRGKAHSCDLALARRNALWV